MMSNLLMAGHNIAEEIVPELMPSALQCCNIEDILFLEEIENYLQRYPNTRHVEIFLHDLNGHVRGKRIDIAGLKNIVQGSYFPLSIYAMSLDGEVIEESGLGKSIGEPDYLCKPVLGSLQPCALNPESNAQLFLTMKDDHHQDCQIEPRNILKKSLRELHNKNFYPCMAAELEFYLLDSNEKADADNIYLNQCLDVNSQDKYQEVLDEIERIALLQGIQIIGLVSESSSGQYEINIQHSGDILKLCDQIMMLKRTIKQVAVKYGLHASFLAKPDMHKAGSGMHFHMSMLNQDQQNIFSAKHNPLPSRQLLKAISGLIVLLPPSMAVLAPNVNSFRRFKAGNHVPLEANWGVNNRNVAIRIPCSDSENQRLEYRVAGADCNPYLTVAMILIGALHGLTQNLEIPQQATQIKVKDKQLFLNTNQQDALALFHSDAVLQKYLGKKFMELWCVVKHAEHQHIYSQITLMEQHWDI
jgi:gamma-glutamylputrescine synthase